MGRLTRALVAALLAWTVTCGALPSGVLGFSGFGTTSAEATYGRSMVFRVELPGGAPERLELLLRFAGDEATLVAPVAAEGSSAEYVWDAADRHVTPNTRIDYSWRAIDGGRTTVSRSGTLLYDDDRPGLDWQSARLGEATVHWYGRSETIARRFGDLAAEGAAQAEELLGHEMSGAVDIFVYASRDDFFGALGPGAREWTGAATYPALRTIFMSLESGDLAYQETALVHEVTHVVFNDATQNPFHEPAKWLNEGFATWSEQQSADSERSTVAFEAAGGGLFAFDAISEQFPIGDRESRLAYAQGATMVDMIIAEHGRDAIARLAAAYRDGASDAEALRDATGMDAGDLYDDFYAEFGVQAPEPIEPAPILPSNVRKPGAPSDGSGGSQVPDPDPPPGATGGGLLPWIVVVAAVAGLAGLVGFLAWAGRRRSSGRSSA